MGARVLLGVWLASLLLAAGAQGQQPDQPLAPVLAGMVIDESTGRPVPGAVIGVNEPAGGQPGRQPDAQPGGQPDAQPSAHPGGGPPRAVTDSLGAFTLHGVPSGSFEIVVQRFGYREQRLRVGSPGTEQPLVVRLEVDPLQLDSVVASGAAQVRLDGAVLDARSGEPVPWASVWLSRYVADEGAQTSGNSRGAFTLEDVRTGVYLIRVDKLGYVSQYRSIGVSAPPEAITVLLEPDSTMLHGLDAMAREMRTRRSASASQVRVYDENRLRLSPSPDVRHFLTREPSLEWTGCPGNAAVRDCLVHRLRVVSPRVFIDDFQRELEDLVSLAPGDVFQIETFTCSRAVEIRVYTTAFMERMARNPGLLLPACSNWS